MPRILWPMLQGRTRIEITIFPLAGGSVPRTLLADTGAGSVRSRFELVLLEKDCADCGGNFVQFAQLQGAVTGLYPVFGVRVQIPQLGFDQNVRIVGVQRVTTGFDGIAALRFLNRFTYGNFGDPLHFGLEV